MAPGAGGVPGLALVGVEPRHAPGLEGRPEPRIQVRGQVREPARPRRDQQLTGDAPASIETYRASRYGEALQSDVLKLGHHGSKTSSAELWLGYVDPEYAVISAGCDNSYGHPHQEVLDRLERFGIKKVSTCGEGTIVFESDGRTVRRTD